MGMDIPRRAAETEEAFRRMLEGPCVLVGDRWFGGDSSPAEREAYLRAWNARRERNWRRRARRRSARIAAREAERLARLPPWVRTRLTGHTADWTQQGGVPVPVDYRATYSRPAFGPGWLESDPLVQGLLAAARAGVRAIGEGIVRAATRIQRAARPTSPSDGWSALMRTERRKICRRSTTAPSPTATDIRVAWHFAQGSPEGRLRLGRLLMDLECHVRNDLRVNWIANRPKIVARLPGIRGWIRENCPELAPKYKTMMRFKSLATRARQAAGGTDPLPAGEALPARIAPATIQIQPRARGVDEPRTQRFAWEFGERRTDADGRPFLTNPNYARAARDPFNPPRADRGPRRIVLNGTPNRTIENYSPSHGTETTRPSSGSVSDSHRLKGDGNWG